MPCLITYMVRSEKNGYGLLRLGLKTGVGNGIFWSEIGSGFGDAGCTPPPKIPRSTPPGVRGLHWNGLVEEAFKRDLRYLHLKRIPTSTSLAIWSLCATIPPMFASVRLV